MLMVLLATVTLVDLSVAIMQVTVSVAVMQLQVSAAIKPVKTLCSEYVGDNFC